MGKLFNNIFEFFTGSEEAAETRKVEQKAHNVVKAKKSKAQALDEMRKRNKGGLSTNMVSPVTSVASSSVAGGESAQLLNPLQK